VWYRVSWYLFFFTLVHHGLHGLGSDSMHHVSHLELGFTQQVTVGFENDGVGHHLYIDLDRLHENRLDPIVGGKFLAGAAIFSYAV